jgi:predicted RNA-binding protein with PIN domain
MRRLAAGWNSIMTGRQDFEYLVDGYNLLLYQRRGKLRSGPGNLERARTALLNWLAKRAERPERISVIFDVPPDQRRSTKGSLQRREPEWSIVRGVRVAFAHGYSEADGLIADMCMQHSHPDRLRVVSNDRQVQEVARRSRAAWLDCATFLAMFTDRNERASLPQVPEADDRTPDVDQAEVQRWLEAFGGEPPQSETEKKSPIAPPTIPPPPVRPTYLEDPGLAEFYREMREATEPNDEDDPPPKPKKR